MQNFAYLLKYNTLIPQTHIRAMNKLIREKYLRCRTSELIGILSALEVNIPQVTMELLNLQLKVAILSDILTEKKSLENVTQERSLPYRSNVKTKQTKSKGKSK